MSEDKYSDVLILGGLDSGMPHDHGTSLNESSEFSLWTNSSVEVNVSSFELNPDEYVPYNLRPETYIIPVLFAIIFIIGMAGNGTLIIVFLKHRTMRNVPNMYIVSLAVGDLLVILFCVPFTSTVYTVESWPYGLLVCKFSEFIKDVSIGVSVFTLTALSADRYFAIVDPMRKLHGRRATRITCISIVGIWIVSIIFAIPSMLNSFIWTIEDHSNNHTYDVCYPFPQELGPTYPKIVVMFKFLVYYAIPLGFIATFYVIMAKTLLLSAMPGEPNTPGQAKQIQSRKKVAKMVLLISDFWHVVRMVGFCLSFINSCLNPITLYCISSTFRKHFNYHLFCCCCPQEVSLRGLRAPGYSTAHTEHNLCHDRSRNGTQISRASTVVGPGRRSIGSQNYPHWVHNESHLKPLLHKNKEAPGLPVEVSNLDKEEGYPMNHLNINVSSINIGKEKIGSDVVTVEI